MLAWVIVVAWLGLPLALHATGARNPLWYAALAIVLGTGTGWKAVSWTRQEERIRWEAMHPGMDWKAWKESRKL